MIILREIRGCKGKMFGSLDLRFSVWVLLILNVILPQALRRKFSQGANVIGSQIDSLFTGNSLANNVLNWKKLSCNQFNHVSSKSSWISE